MSGSCLSERRDDGSSLLEVLIALSLLASAILGAAAAQLAALRSADTQTHREQAAWIAQSIAESLSFPERPASWVAHVQARAARVLPGIHVSIADEARDAGALVVEWGHRPGSIGRGRSPGLASCPPADDSGLSPCIALPFASR
ncbi:hypothetical protein [Trinickia soli]|uniref:hypothetical protein n=1 Tax=Trinickia soli TaxID=380675 RepID=UPI0012B71007